MSKVTVFYLVFSKSFVDLFLFFFWVPHIFSLHIPDKVPPAYYFFDFLDLKTSFLDFLNLKNWSFRPKNFFKSTQNLKKHLFSIQIDKKNNIFNFRLYSKKLPYS